MHDAAWAALCLAALLLAMETVRRLDRRFDLHPEVRRKLLHVGMGAICCSFPWLFTRTGWVAATCFGAVALMSIVRARGTESGTLGATLYGVARRSRGEIWFALAVVLLFALAQSRPVLYVAALLVLTLGDTAAALIGVHYGRLRYATRESTKSWEGSFALAGVTFLAVHVPLLLWTPTGRAECLLLALIVATLVVLLEGLAWNGLDNLFLPLGTWFVLAGTIDLGTESLLWRLAGLLALVAVALLLARRVALATDGIMAAIVACFVFWSAGDWLWLVPVLVVFAAHPFLSDRKAGRPELRADARAVLAIAASMAPWLVAAELGLGDRAYYLFAIGFAAHLTMIQTWQLVAGRRYERVALQRLLLIALRSWIVMTVPVILAYEVNPVTLRLAFAALPIVIAATIAYARLAPQRSDQQRLALQGVLAVAAGALGWIPVLLFVTPP